LKENLLQKLNENLKNLKHFFKTCDPKDPNIIKIARMLRGEINKLSQNRSFSQNNSQLDEDLFVYFSKLSEEFEMIPSRLEQERRLSKNSFSSETSNMFKEFYGKLGAKNPLTPVMSENDLFNSNFEESEFQNIYDNLERTYQPKLARMDIEENGSVNEGLEVLLENFSGFLNQIRRTVDSTSQKHVKKSFESRIGTFENKWKEVVHQMILGNVRLEAKKLQHNGDIFFQNKVRDCFKIFYKFIEPWCKQLDKFSQSH
jgi:hypothetical protein